MGRTLFGCTRPPPNTITVTTTADSGAADGRTSLREAFATANANGVDDIIVLAAGATYGLSDASCGAQRAVVRPQGTGCEPGSVEITEASTTRSRG